MNKSILISLLLICFFTFNTNAQDKYSISLGGGYASFKMSGNTKSSGGLGLDLTAKALISDNVEAFAQTGYNAYLSNGYNVAFIPMLVGANVRLADFKAGLGMGYGSSTAGGSTKGGFTISPQVAYTTNNLDFVVHYTSANTKDAGTWSMFGFKILHKLF